jgi:hypothetical protein
MRRATIRAVAIWGLLVVGGTLLAAIALPLRSPGRWHDTKPLSAEELGAILRFAGFEEDLRAEPVRILTLQGDSRNRCIARIDAGADLLARFDAVRWWDRALSEDDISVSVSSAIREMPWEADADWLQAVQEPGRLFAGRAEPGVHVVFKVTPRRSGGTVWILMVEDGGALPPELQRLLCVNKIRNSRHLLGPAPSQLWYREFMPGQPVAHEP